MFAILHVLWIFVVDIFKSRRRLEAENLFLHHQLNIALRRAPPRLRLYGSDRALLVWMTRIWPGLLDISRVVKPETILRWHRSGFKAFWRWKSRNRAGRPKVDRELRDLIRACTPSTIMNRARTYHCTRMRHCIEQSNGLVPSLLCPSWVDCIIATRGYDFREGQG